MTLYMSFGRTSDVRVLMKSDIVSLSLLEQKAAFIVERGKGKGKGKVKVRVKIG